MGQKASARITDAERATLARDVRGRIADIARTNFPCDPIVVDDASLAASEISSAYKRHGLILEKALLVALGTRTDLTAWTDRIAIASRPKPIQIDLLVHSVQTGALTAYEIKRGFGTQDSEAQHSIKQRLSDLKIALPEYATSRGLHASAFDVAVIGYYGRLGTRMGPHRVIDQQGLVHEFDPQTADFVVEVNEYFRHCLLRQTAPRFARALQQISEIAAFRDAVGPVEDRGALQLSEFSTVHHPWDSLG